MCELASDENEEMKENRTENRQDESGHSDKKCAANIHEIFVTKVTSKRDETDSDGERKCMNRVRKTGEVRWRLLVIRYTREIIIKRRSNEMIDIVRR